jgi:glutamyl-tRNA synthetase
MYRFALWAIDEFELKDLRTALYNFICAKQANEKFIIRIVDIENEKTADSNYHESLELLNLFGITYDQIHYQSENLRFHRQLASKLLMDGHAFSCFCTAEELEQKREEAKKSKTTYHYDGTCKKLSDAKVMANENPFVVRIKEPEEAIEFTDIIKGKIRFEPKDIDDFIILKVNKTPTYNFASAIDDMLTNINLIIEEESHLLDIPKQELVRKYLGYSDEIKYAHLPIMIEDKSLNLRSLLEEGFLPTAIINYLIIMDTKAEKELFTLDEAIKRFDLKDISKTPAKFDIEILKELNQEHIKKLNPLELSKFIGYSSKDIGELAKIYLKESATINEIKVKIDTIFSTKTCEEFTEEFEILKSASKDMPYFKEYDEFRAYLEKESGIKGEKFVKLLQILITGNKKGPKLSEIYPHIKNYLGEIIK